MCRTTDFPGLPPTEPRRSCLKIKGFNVRLSGLIPNKYNNRLLPESLTLVYLPRIDEADLVIDGNKIRPDTSGFVTLHRFVNGGEAVFGSGERVRVGEGVRFQVYLGEERVLEGGFRKDEEEEWKLELECTSGLSGELSTAEAEAEVSVAVEGRQVGMLTETVNMRVSRRKRERCFSKLEVIVEEREEVAGDGWDGGRCCCDRGGEAGEEEEGEGESGLGNCEKIEMDLELERVRWAVNVGIWVACLGVGLLVSKASAKSLRRLRLL